MAVHVVDQDGIRTVTIDRPAVRNAVDGPTAAALEDAFRDFGAADDLAVAILTGAGGTFCAGADLHALADPARTNRLERSDHAPLGPTRLRLSKPVVAAIEGYAVGGGLELALWCDLRVAADDATLGVFSRRFGVPLVDGGTARLPRLIGAGPALDLILTGRPVGAREALGMGLVSRVVPSGRALAEASTLARGLAALPQTTLRADLASTHAAFDLPLDEALLAEHDRGMAAIAAGGLDEGVERFRRGEGRHGTWDPRVS